MQHCEYPHNRSGGSGLDWRHGGGTCPGRPLHLESGPSSGSDHLRCGQGPPLRTPAQRRIRRGTRQDRPRGRRSRYSLTSPVPRTIICDEYVVLAAVAGDLEPALALAERRTTPSAYMRLLRPLHRFVLGNRDPGRYTDILGVLSAETLDLLEGIPRDLVVLEDERMLLRQVARQSTRYGIPPRDHAPRGIGIALSGSVVSRWWHSSRLGHRQHRVHVRRACRPFHRVLQSGTATGAGH